MVGVPGRSKACRTCRRRKKGCDLQQPSCGQCRKACIPCEGYSMCLVIHRYHGIEQGPEVFPTKENDATQDRVILSPKARLRSTQAQSHSSMTIMDHIAFPRAALESAFEGMFWDSYLPNGRCLSFLDVNQRTLGGSISVVRDLLTNSTLLRTSLGAMALRSAADRNENSRSMKEQAMRIHASALQQMRGILSNRRNNDLELLSATRVFSFYEALYGSDWADKTAHYRSWSVHHSGDLAFMISKPPEYYCTGVAHRLFVDGRLNQALYALVSRKKSVLTEPVWMTVPWKVHDKTPKDLLVDILLEIPSLYGGIDRMEGEGHFNVDSRQELQRLAYTTIVRLLGWGAEFGISVRPSRPDWQFASNSTTDELVAVHLMTFYWATLIIAYNSYRRISNQEPHDLGINVDDCCRKIIHCIPLFLHPSTGIFRQHLMPFPAMTAIQHVNSTRPPVLQPEREYLLSISGMYEFAGMRKFMLSLKPQLFAGSESVDTDLAK